jgi:Spy/CpxP family protein refolding chaperone
MSKRIFVPQAVLSLLVAAALSLPVLAAVEDLPGMDTAANMKEWLKLSDEQVAKLEPVITTRIEKVDAALAKVDAAEEPDAVAFIEEYGAIKKEFNTGVAAILTPEQAKQWETFKAELEKDLVQEGAKKQSLEHQTVLNLTDEQAAKLEPALATSIQKKLDALQKLVDSGRISMRDKLQAKRTLGDINGELDKAMATVLTPEQLAEYKAAAEK